MFKRLSSLPTRYCGALLLPCWRARKTPICAAAAGGSLCPRVGLSAPMDAIAAALCVPVPFVLRHVSSPQQATLLLEVRARSLSARRSVGQGARVAADHAAGMRRPPRARAVPPAQRTDIPCTCLSLAPQVAAGAQELQRLVDQYGAVVRQGNALAAAWAQLRDHAQAQPHLGGVRTHVACCTLFARSPHAATRARSSCVFKRTPVAHPDAPRCAGAGVVGAGA